MPCLPTLAHALADLKTTTATGNPVILREIKAVVISQSLEMMVAYNKTDQARDVVNTLMEKQIECDPAEVFYSCFAYGNLEMIKIFERYQPVRSENIPHCVMLAFDRGQMEAARWALQKAQEYWGEMVKDHLNANKLIVKAVDSHMLTRQNVHEVVQWLAPFNTDDLSFAVVRASMREHKNTARFLLKHSDPQKVLEQIGDNYTDPKMQWLMDLINKNQRTTLKNSVPKCSHHSPRKHSLRKI